MPFEAKTLEEDGFPTLSVKILHLRCCKCIVFPLYLQSYSKEALESVQEQLKIAQKSRVLSSHLFEVNRK